jgi:hypothetical protein
MYRDSLALPVPVPGGVLQPTFCSATVDGVLTNNPVAIEVVANQIVAFEKQYQGHPRLM